MTEISSDMLDRWATDDAGPVALVMRQRFVSVEGKDGIIFPPTYAMNRTPPYNIDELADGTKVALVDSVGSQANRMEPLFEQSPLDALVPQVVLEVGEGAARKEISLFEVGHRIADALVRSTDLHEEVEAVFTAFANGDAEPMARLAPTSLVFGVWDSRGEGVKVPRLVNAEIRAWGVEPLTRSAQYEPPVDYAEFDVFDEKDKEQAEGDPKNPLAQAGFVHVPSVGQHGGIVVHGEIVRTVTVNLVALRRLEAANAGNTAALRRYILGLALAAATAEMDPFLRQGCILVPAPEWPAAWQMVCRDGSRENVSIDRDAVLAWARGAAAAFGVKADRRMARFDRKLAHENAKKAKNKKAKKKK